MNQSRSYKQNAIFFPPVPSNLLNASSLQPQKKDNSRLNTSPYKYGTYQSSPYLGQSPYFDIGLKLPQIVTSKNGVFANSYCYSQTPTVNQQQMLSPTEQLKLQIISHNSSLFKPKRSQEPNSASFQSIKDSIISIQGNKPGNFFDSRGYVKNMAIDLQKQIMTKKQNRKSSKKKKKVVEEEDDEEEEDESDEDSQNQSRLTDKMTKLKKPQRKEFMKQKLIIGLMKEKAIKKKVKFKNNKLYIIAGIILFKQIEIKGK